MASPLHAVPYMDQPLDKIAVSGPILAHIMQDFGSSRGDCDGLLFGHLDKTMASNLGDGDEQTVAREELTAIITGFYSSGVTFGFYDAAGHIELAKLANMTKDRESYGGDPPIGWFMGRRNSPARPSLRETAITWYLRITSSLLARNAGDIGVAQPQISSQNVRESKPDGSQPTDGSSSKINRQSSQSGGDDSHNSTTAIVSPSGGVSSPIDVDVPSFDSPRRSKQNLFKDGLHHQLRSAVKPDAEIAELAMQANMKNSFKTSKTNQIAMHAASLSETLSKPVGVPASSPCIFMLFTESGTQEALHTYDYRAYQYHHISREFEPRTVRIVNIGPAFRGHYDSFSPVSPFPLLSSTNDEENESHSSTDSPASRPKQRDLHEGSRRTRPSSDKQQILLDAYSEGYRVEKLASFVRPDGMQQVQELEDLYARMLSKLTTLTKQVCESSSTLIEQEKMNAQMRAGLQ